MQNGFIHPEFLVETGWLAAHEHDPAVVILDATTHLVPDPPRPYKVVPGRGDFEAGHIPGAQFVDLQADLSDNAQKLRFMAPSEAQFAAAMDRLGVGEGTRVIVYSTANPWWATRVWWLLREFGFDNAAVLNGGFQKWRREARPEETGPGQPRPHAHFPRRGRRHLMVGKEEVKAAIGDPGICTMNALLPAQFAGTGGVSYGRPGHITGSINLPAAHLLDPETNIFLPAEVLRRKFEKVGAMDREVIAYCGGGIAASADALILVMLGHEKVKLYDASLSEWVADPSLPMSTGEAVAGQPG